MDFPCFNLSKKPELDMDKFSSLPIDTVSEIMWRLEPSSLVRCKCLNKSWERAITFLLKDPDFAAKHLVRADSTTVIVFEPPMPELRFERSTLRRKSAALFMSKRVEDRFPKLTTRHIDLPCYLSEQLTSPLEVCHCNGVLCFVRGPSDIDLYNPTLRHLRSFHPEPDVVVTDSLRALCTGFGSNPRGRDYKIIRLYRRGGPSNPTTAHVYVPGRSWREIEISSPIRDTLSRQKAIENHVYFKGNSFWVMQANDDNDDDSRKVLRFDVSRETFHVILFPRDFVTRALLMMCTILGGSLRFVSYPRRGDRAGGYETINMCNMDLNEDGASRGYTHSWRRCRTIEPLWEIFYPLTFLERDELVHIDALAFQITTYNIRTGLYSGVPIPMMLGNDVLYAGQFVKSLVSFPPQ